MSVTACLGVITGRNTVSQIFLQKRLIKFLVYRSFPHRRPLFRPRAILILTLTEPADGGVNFNVVNRPPRADLEDLIPGGYSTGVTL